MIMNTLVFVIALTLGLLQIPNRSNFPETIYLPILVSMFAKYVIGDWDKGYTYTTKDVVYWVSQLVTSYMTIQLYKKIKD